jgi:hypothetical protein
MKSKKRSYYLHTIDGKPAEFNHPYICFSNKRIKLADSLAQIRQEHDVTLANDDEAGKRGEFIYGYVTVVLPD